LVAILACAVVARWGYLLCRSTAGYLVDAVDPTDRGEKLAAELRALELPVASVLLWEVAANQFAVVVTLVSQSDEGAGLADAVESALRERLPVRQLAFRFKRRDP